MLNENVTDQTLIEEFEKYLLEVGKSPKTVTSYLGDTRGFLEWLTGKQVTFTGQLSRFYITSFKDHLIKNNYSINTINKKIKSLISFNYFLIEKGLTNSQVVYPDKDKIKIAAGSEAEIEVFTEAEIEQILFYLEDKDKVSERDKVVILVLLYTGLRVSELVNIKIKDIDLLTLNLKVVGKGGKYREVPLKAEVAAAIKVYLEGERRESKFVTSEYLLLTQRSSKMNKDAVNKLINKHGKELNMVIRPHKFRHTFCTRLINKGAELTTVSKLAGHSNIQTTAKFYINTSREEKQEAVDLL
jgi:integrase/recombinase XerD